MIVRVGNDDVDMTRITRLQPPEFRALLKCGFSWTKALRGKFDDDQESALILFFIRRVRPSTTPAEIGDLPLVTCNRLSFHVMANIAQWAPLTTAARKGKR